MSKLANAAIDGVGRRVQHEALAHRGRQDDSLCRIRKLLLLTYERLDAAGDARLQATRAAGDPYEEASCTYLANQPALGRSQLRRVYAAGDGCAACAALGRFHDRATTVEIPEVARLATTIDRSSDQVLACYRTRRASFGTRRSRQPRGPAS